MRNRHRKRLAIATAAVLALSTNGTSSAVQASGTDSATNPGITAEQPRMLLVHGYGSAKDGKDCNNSTWADALTYYQSAGGRSRESMVTIGYYKGDTGQVGGQNKCDFVIGNKNADNSTSIRDIARDLANYIHDNYSPGNPVDIVVHSMGGLITRVAVLGTYEHWEGFPESVFVQDIVTLGTPHQGVRGGCPEDSWASDGDPCRQWNQMVPSDAGGSGFIDKLHESEPGAGDRGLDDAWASGIDWSLVGSEEDPTVSYRSAIDQGYFANQKYGYDEDRNNNGSQDCWSPEEVDHQTIRELTGSGGFCLRYWHDGSDGGPYTTDNGWSPLKTAFKAATHDGDDLPR